jgi:hypothetical protein
MLPIDELIEAATDYVMEHGGISSTLLRQVCKMAREGATKSDLLGFLLRETSQDAPGSTISSPIPPVTPTQGPAANGQGEATNDA